MIRISTDPTDPHYDERPRRVTVNGKEVGKWITADEFRRCVITPEGVVYGAVSIERLPESEEVEIQTIAPTAEQGVPPRKQGKPARKSWR